MHFVIFVSKMWKEGDLSCILKLQRHFKGPPGLQMHYQAVTLKLKPRESSIDIFLQSKSSAKKTLFSVALRPVNQAGQDRRASRR